MPYIATQDYLETDLSPYEDYHIIYTLQYVARKYQEIYQPDMPAIQPSIEEGLALVEEFSKARIWSYPGPDAVKLGQISRLRKAVVELGRTWGDYMTVQVIQGRIRYYFTGFPYVSINCMRLPRTTLSFTVAKDKRNGTYHWSCRLHVTPLTYFHLEASAGGGAWFPLGTFRRPSGRIRKLDPGTNYSFRMYTSNPKGKSGYSYSMVSHLDLRPNRR